MSEWYNLVQTIVEEIDECIQKCHGETLTLSSLARKLGYSEYYISRKFIEISGMHFRDYLRHRTLAVSSGYCLDTTQGRVFYFYHDPERFWKYIRPVKKL